MSHSFKVLDINLSSTEDHEIARLIKKAYWDFYGSVKRLWNIFKMSPNKIYLLRLVIFYILLDKRLFKLKHPFKKEA